MIEHEHYTLNVDILNAEQIFINAMINSHKLIVSTVI